MTSPPPLRLRDLLALPFAVVRVPLYAVDRQVVQRLDRASAVRVALEYGLGTVDICAGHLLDEESITRYGMGRIRATRDASARTRSITTRS